MSTTEVTSSIDLSLTTQTSTLTSLTTQSEQQINLHFQYIIDLGRSINFYGTPFITAFGFFGNICTFLIMSRRGFNKSSTSIYFRWLAVVDFDILLFNQIFTSAERNLDIRYHFWLRNDILCKLNYANFGWSMTTSAMLLVAVTFERFLITALPLKSKIYCTRRNAKITCASIAGGLGVIWLISLFHLDPKWGTCQEVKNRVFLFTYARWMITVVYTYIATPTIFILNSFLVYKLILARRTRKKMTASAMTSQDVASYAQYQRLTMMAVTVSVAYFVLTLPTTTINTIGNWVDMSVMTSFKAWISVAHDVCLMIRTFNHAINFVLYLLINNRIRAEFISMMTCKKTDVVKVKSTSTPRVMRKSSSDNTVRY